MAKAKFTHGKTSAEVEGCSEKAADDVVRAIGYAVAGAILIGTAGAVYATTRNQKAGELLETGFKLLQR